MATETDGHGATEAAGMPQLEFSTFPNQIFWLVVALVIIFMILSRIALPRIASVLAERRGVITGETAAAAELKRRAEEAEAAYNRALADARAEAARIVAEAKAEIQAELDVAMERADAEIAAKAAESEKLIAEIRASAFESVESVALSVTADIVEAMGAKPDEPAINGAVSAHAGGLER